MLLSGSEKEPMNPLENLVIKNKGNRQLRLLFDGNFKEVLLSFQIQFTNTKSLLTLMCSTLNYQMKT